MSAPTRWIPLLSLVVLIALGSLPVAAQPGPPEDRFQGPDRARVKAETARLVPIQKRHENAMLDRPRVHGMGIVLDPITDELVFEIAVEREGLVPDLPSRIEGVPVRIVREDPPVVLNGGAACAPCHANQLALPVQMGNSTSNGQYCFSCTLGFKMCKNGTHYYVTNAHCSPNSSGCAASAPIGSATYHRGRLDASCNLASNIGNLTLQVPPVCNGSNNFVDAALVTSPNTKTSWAIRDIGTPATTWKTAVVGDQVQKSGRTTGQTFGSIASVNYTSDVTGYACCGSSGIARFASQIKVNAATAPFSQGGDSGSGLFDRSTPAKLVGLLFAGPPNGSYGLANHFLNVQAYLGGSFSLDPNCQPPTCQDQCYAQHDFCDEEYCYWNYNQYMCQQGCDLELQQCLASCP